MAQMPDAPAAWPLHTLAGKIAVVTGAGSGIGRQVATDLAKAGATVFAVDKNIAGWAETCGPYPERMFLLSGDVTSMASVQHAVDAVWKKHQGLDILINCAGVYSMQMMIDVTEAEYDKMLSINLKGLFFCSQAAARYMIEAGRGGAIVNIASAAGRRPSVGSIVYSASKAGVISMTQGMAQELAPHQIRVNAIAPGAVQTPMWDAVKLAYGKDHVESEPTIEQSLLAATPLGRLCSPQDCSDAVHYFCTDQSAFITGQTLNVDGGMFFN